MTKLILGTAQFGQPYGIKGDGVPSEQELERIARLAWDGGIRVIHTSWQYNLPKISEAIFSEFEKITKSPLNPEIFWFRGKPGYVFYGPLDVLDKWEGDCRVKQMPVNILDRRFDLQGAKKRGWELHARSVFLQGLLLMEELPSWVQGQARGHIKLFQHVCREKGFQYYEAALGWVLGLDEIDHVIVGVNSAKQLEQLLNVKPLKWDYDFSIQDEMVLDPRRWPKA